MPQTRPRIAEHFCAVAAAKPVKRSYFLDRPVWQVAASAESKTISPIKVFLAIARPFGLANGYVHDCINMKGHNSAGLKPGSAQLPNHRLADQGNFQ
jgi:hypothetical protein